VIFDEHYRTTIAVNRSNREQVAGQVRHEHGLPEHHARLDFALANFHGDVAVPLDEYLFALGQGDHGTASRRPDGEALIPGGNVVGCARVEHPS